MGRIKGKSDYSIPLKDRKPMPSSMGFPCHLCVKIERLRRMITKGQKCLDLWLKPDKKEFMKANRDVAIREAQAFWDLFDDKKKELIIFENIVQSNLRNMWKKESKRIGQKFLMAKRLEMLHGILSEIQDEHPKCAGCGILFGDFHLDSPASTSIGDLCSNCFKLYKKFGSEYFKQYEDAEGDD